MLFKNIKNLFYIKLECRQFRWRANIYIRFSRTSPYEHPGCSVLCVLYAEYLIWFFWVLEPTLQFLTQKRMSDEQSKALGM